jgi:hypothetical protein
VYVCFDGDSDIHYYRLMKAWHQSDHTLFNFYDAHDLNYARDSSLESSIKSQLRVRLENSRIMVVLVGQSTRYLYKFVRWEIEQALALGMPIIVVNLNNMRQMDPELCPPILRTELAIHISFRSSIMQHALETWPTEHLRLRSEGRAGPFFFQPQVYARLGVPS